MNNRNYQKELEQILAIIQANQSQHKKPEIQQNKAEESKAEESKAEESKVEESKAEESKVEESKVEESKAEESKAEISKTEGTKTEEAITEDAPTLMLHSCCAPCSSYVMEYLCQYFKITVFYYNPNISSSVEYQRRLQEEKRLIQAYNEEEKGYSISIIDGEYEPGKFLEQVKGLEYCEEGGERCFKCFELRLSETAKLARAKGFDYFATTLTISPLKNAKKINEIGEEIAQKEGICWLPSDFKKKNGYKRSIELSKEYNLYRQNYCGCSFSKEESLHKAEK